MGDKEIFADIRYRLEITFTTGMTSIITVPRWGYGDGMLWWEELGNEMTTHYRPLNSVAKITSHEYSVGFMNPPVED